VAERIDPLQVKVKMLKRIKTIKTNPVSMEDWNGIVTAYYMKLVDKYGFEQARSFSIKAGITKYDVDGNALSNARPEPFDEAALIALVAAERDYIVAHLEEYIMSNDDSISNNEEGFRKLIVTIEKIFKKYDIYCPEYKLHGKNELNNIDIEDLKNKIFQVIQSSKNMSEAKEESIGLLTVDQIFENLIDKELLELGIQNNGDADQISDAYKIAHYIFWKFNINPPSIKKGEFSNKFLINKNNKNINQLSNYDIKKLNEKYQDIIKNPLQYNALS
jgi:hypothetical protein